MKKDKYKKKDVDDLFKIFISWLQSDIFKAGYQWNYIEKKNEAYGRGYRAALHNIIRKAEELLKENYLP